MPMPPIQTLPGQISPPIPPIQTLPGQIYPPVTTLPMPMPPIQTLPGQIYPPVTTLPMPLPGQITTPITLPAFLSYLGQTFSFLRTSSLKQQPSVQPMIIVANLPIGSQSETMYDSNNLRANDI
jgi:hypothetical protein